MRLSLRAAGIAFLAAVAITCTDAPTSPSSKAASTARIHLTPHFSADAAKIYNELAAFGQEVTEVHVHLVGPDGTQRDTVIAFPAGSDTLAIEIPVPTGSVDQPFTALIELRNDQHTVLFSGTQVVTARAEHLPFLPDPVVDIHYAGPGKGTKTITVLPIDSTAAASATVPFRATAVDSSGNPVTDLLVRWTTSDATLASATLTSNSTASIVGQGRRGTVTISAITPSGIVGTSRLTLVPPASRVVVISGGNQTAVAGSTLAQPFVVEVQATDNLPVPGATVAFRSITASGSVTSATAVTDATGRASTTLKLGGVAGAYQFEASSGALAAVTVSETATPAQAAAVTLVSGDQQVDSIGRTLPLPLVVKVTDSFGGPVNAATVTWTKVSGAGTVGTASVSTGVDGLASTTYLLGNVAGTDVVSATVAGAGSVSFSERAIARGLSTITIVSGGGQSGTAGSVLPVPLVAKATDALNNPLPNISVTWAATGATFSPVTATTAANGQVSTIATLGGASGPVAVTATAGTVAGSTSLTVTTPPVVNPPTITKTLGDAQSAIAGTAVAVAPTVLVKDGNGNVMAGAQVVFAVASGGGSATGTTTTTNANGLASVGTWTLGATAGANTLTATSNGLTATFTATGTVGAAAKFAFVQALPASIVVGGAATTVSARLLDAQNNPVLQAGVVVTGTPTFTPGPGSGALSATTNASGVATFTIPSYVGTIGSMTFALSASGFTTLTSAAVPVTVGAAAGLSIATAPATSVQAGVALSPQPVIQLVDVGNNAVSQAAVNVTATIASGGGTLGGTATVATNASGIAAFTNLSIAGAAGPRTLTFASGTLTPVTSATITVGSGAAASMSLLAGSGQQATAGSAVAIAPSVKVVDGFGNGVAGVVVTYQVVTNGSQVSNGGPLATSATVTTNASGVAALTQWVLGNVAQTYTMTASATVPSGSPVTFTADAVAATGSVLAIATAPSATATNGVALGTQPVIQLKDTFGNAVPTAGIVVTAAITSGTGTLSSATATTVAGGAATFAGLAMTGTAGNFVLQFSAPGYAPVSSGTIVLSAGALASITLTPPSVALVPSGTQQFSAVGKDASGNVVTITPTWTATTGGTISATGLFTAGTTAGTFANTVHATSGTIVGTASVTVSAGALASITVTPASAALAAGGTQQFTAVGADANGNVVDIAPTWTSGTGGTINATGLFTAGTTAGTFANTVHATSGTIVGNASVTVNAGALATITVTPNTTSLAVNGTQQFNAVGTDANGNVVSITPTWTSGAGGIITSTGLFTAGTTAGTFTNTVHAGSGTIIGAASVTVNAGALASITVTPASTVLATGGTQQFTAIGADANGNVVAVTPTWTSGTGGTINATGLFTAGTTAGTFANTVHATSGTIVGNASVTVNAGALASITVTPSSASLAVNGTQQFTAVGTDANGNTVSITPTWTSGAGGTITGAGLFTAGATAGTFTNTVHATSGTIVGTASVTVNAGALATITVTPSSTSLAINGTQQFTAVGTDANGNAVSITPTWTSGAGGIITSTGLFTAGTTAGTFANSVHATSGTIVGNASVTVSAGALATITVTPSSTSLAVNGTQQFTAVGKDASGNVVSISPTWSASTGGTINATGLFTAGTTAGTFANTVHATSGTIVGTASVTVNAGVLATITVTPASTSLAVNGTQQFTAVGTDANGNAVSISPTWTSGAGGIITSTGLFTAGTTAGTFTNTVHATSGTIVGTASVTVNAGVLATITVTPSSTSLAINGTQQFTAVGTDANGNVVSITPTWTSGAGGIITSTGLFTAGTTAGTFTNTVHATSGTVVGNASVTVNAGALATITVTPSSTSLAVNGTQQFTAVGKDASGNAVSISPTWSASTGGTINATGLFTAGTTAGTFTNTVHATSGTIVGTASVTVNAGVLATITVTPSSTSLAINGTQQFTAVGTDANGNVVSITPTWSASTGGTINGTGLFTAGTTAGTFTNTVHATSGTIVGTASVTVNAGVLATITVTPSSTSLAINGTQQFTAVGTDANGNVVSITPTWSASTGGTINGTGLFTAGTTAGTFTNTVHATSGAVVGTASVTVNAGALATITVTPGSTSLAVGGTQQFTAVGKDASGNVVSISPTWSASTGGTINGTGLFTAGTTAGTFTNTVHATSGTIVGTASVTVNAGVLATITVTPSSTSLAINGTQQFTAVGTDANGNVVSITPTWSASTGGTINGTGLFTAGTTAGTFTNTVHATSGAVVGTASVTVNAGALATITVTPGSTSLAVGGTQQFTAVGKDASGNVVSISPTWSASTGGTINSTGLFTAGTTAGTFTNTVHATSGTIVGTASVTVNAGVLATITVTPSSTSLAINGTQQFTAVGTDANGNAVSITPTWTSGAGGIITSTGLFTAGTTAGTFTNTVHATSGTVVGNASVTVNAGALATITVTPSSTSLAVNGTQQFTAVGKDASGNAVSISPTWSASTGGTINATGLFTAGTTAGSFTNTVHATSGTIVGTASVTVNAGALATITVTPASTSLAVSGTQQFTAVGADANGNVVSITPTWSASTGGTINATGLFTAGTTAGTFTNTVHATSGTIVGTASVTVNAGALATITVTPGSTSLAVNATQQFTAVGKDANGNVVSISPTWTAGTGGTINGTGLFTAGTTAGTFTNTVHATSGTVVGTASVTVNAGALATITITPASVTLPTNGTQQFTAVGTDANGNVVSITPTWSAGSGGTINTTGLFTAGTTAGTFNNTVHATSGTVVGNASVTVSAGALATITVAPSTTSLAANGTQQFTAVGRDVTGNVVAISPTWSASTGGTINATGLFTAGTTAGTFTNTVHATSGTIVGTASVTVNAGALATITVTPSTTSLAANGTQQFTAVGTDANGNVVSISPTWTSGAGGIITGTGLFTAGTTAGTFTNTVHATSGTIVGNASVTVNAGALATITVTPSTTSLAANGTQQFTAVGKDANGNVISISPTWTASTGGTINATGLFTAGTTAGTFTNTVHATSGTIVGTASVTVNAGALATITVTPSTTSLAANGTQQFTAVGTDANGNIVSITPTWSASTGGTINGTGLFTAGTTAGTFTNTVHATSGTIVGTASVTVNAGALATITVTPSTTSLAANGTQQFSAVGTDANGNIVSITPTWSASTGGTINGTGLFTAGTTAGTFANTVHATSGAIVGTASVTVNAGAITTITISPNPFTVASGATKQLTAVGTDANGNVVTFTPTWTVAEGGGTISTSGLFTGGITAGTYPNTVIASNGTVTGFASVTVTAGALATITVSPSAPSMAVGGTQQFTAVGKDANGNVVSITPTWSAATGGTINGTGLFTAGTTAGTFANTVHATSGPIVGTASVTVTAGAGTQLAFTTAPSATAASGAALATQPVVQLKDAAGNAVTTAGITITATIASGTGSLTSSTAVTQAGGAATFSGLKISGTIGNFVLAFDAPGYSTLSSGTIALSAGAAKALAMLTQPTSTAQSGIAFATQPRVRLIDDGGNVVSQSGVIVTAAIGTGSPTLGGTLTATTDASGIASFTTLNISGLVGDRTLAFASGALTPVSSATITISAGNATAVSLTTAPSSNAVSGVALAQQPVVQLQDAAGNPVATAGVQVTAAITTGSGGLSNYTATTQAGGDAHFSGLAINGGSGSYVLTFTANAIGSVASGTITISPAPAGLIFTTQPVNTEAGVPLQNGVQVSIVDGNGNVLTGFSGETVSLSVTSGTGTPGATMGDYGNGPVSFSGGTANFQFPYVDTQGTGYTLTATSSNGFTVASATFDVSASTLFGVTITSKSQFARAPSEPVQNGDLVFQFTDINGNPVSGRHRVDSYYSGGFACGGVGSSIFTDTDGRLLMYATLDSGDGSCEISAAVPNGGNSATARIAVTSTNATHVWMAGGEDLSAFETTGNWIKRSTGNNEAPSLATDIPLIPEWSTNVMPITSSNHTFAGLYMGSNRNLDLSNYTFTTTGDVVLSGGEGRVQNGKLIVAGHGVTISNGNVDSLTVGRAGSCSGGSGDKVTLSGINVYNGLTVVCEADFANYTQVNSDVTAGAGSKIRLLTTGSLYSYGDFTFHGDSLNLERDTNLGSAGATFGGVLAVGSDSVYVNVNGTANFVGTGVLNAGHFFTGALVFGGPGSGGYTFNSGDIQAASNFTQLSGGTGPAFVAGPNHTVYFNADVIYTIDMANPSTSRFGKLAIQSPTSMLSDLTFAATTPLSQLEVSNNFTVPSGKTLTLPGNLLLHGGTLVVNGTMTVSSCTYLSGFSQGETVSGSGTINGSPASQFSNCVDGSTGGLGGAHILASKAPAKPRQLALARARETTPRPARGGRLAMVPSKSATRKVTDLLLPNGKRAIPSARVIPRPKAPAPGTPSSTTQAPRVTPLKPTPQTKP